MSKIGQYLFSVVAVAMIISVSGSLVDRKGGIGSIIRFISGLTLVTVIISPWVDVRLSDFSSHLAATQANASIIVQDGQNAARSEISSYIKTQIQAYILDKATFLGLDLAVDVNLTEDSPPTICSITIAGDASPYAKQRLKQIIEEDLSVAEECLIWS